MKSLSTTFKTGILGLAAAVAISGIGNVASAANVAVLTQEISQAVTIFQNAAKGSTEAQTALNAVTAALGMSNVIAKGGNAEQFEAQLTTALKAANDAQVASLKSALSGTNSVAAARTTKAKKSAFGTRSKKAVAVAAAVVASVTHFDAKAAAGQMDAAVAKEAKEAMNSGSSLLASNSSWIGKGHADCLTKFNQADALNVGAMGIAVVDDPGVATIEDAGEKLIDRATTYYSGTREEALNRVCHGMSSNTTPQPDDSCPIYNIPQCQTIQYSSNF